MRSGGFPTGVPSGASCLPISVWCLSTTTTTSVDTVPEVIRCLRTRCPSSTRWRPPSCWPIRTVFRVS
uniref:Putative secreted peptide n=1 Tax=Anopheles braziliensis TaxID=58242 RepID=A0A2M3ZVG5_9DIPT